MEDDSLKENKTVTNENKAVTNESDNITDNRNNDHGKDEAHDTCNIMNDKDDEGNEGMTIIRRSA